MKKPINAINNFHDLEVWKVGHQLVLKTYRLTAKFPDSELYGLVSQLRRAVVSITSNIAEGFGRYFFKDKIRFYYQSRGSAAEVKNLVFISRDLEFINDQEYEDVFKHIDREIMLINGLIQSANRANK